MKDGICPAFARLSCLHFAIKSMESHVTASLMLPASCQFRLFFYRYIVDFSPPPPRSSYIFPAATLTPQHHNLGANAVDSESSTFFQKTATSHNLLVLQLAQILTKPSSENPDLHGRARPPKSQLWFGSPQDSTRLQELRLNHNHVLCALKEEGPTTRLGLAPTSPASATRRSGRWYRPQ